MTKQFFSGANAPDYTFEIPSTPIKKTTWNLAKKHWQGNLLYLNIQQCCTYCSINYRDSLTQIANKRYFHIWLEQVWKRLEKERSPLSIILVEVDYLKIYNKTRGDEAREHCLQQIAQAISDCVQPPDGLAARFGEEKFALIIPENKVSTVFKTAEKIRRNVKILAFYHDPQIDGLPDRMVTVSLGIGSTIVQKEGSQSQLIKAAEEALYQSNRKGRDRTEVKFILCGSQSEFQP